MFGGTQTKTDILLRIPSEQRYEMPLYLPYTPPQHIAEEELWFGKNDSRALPCQNDEMYERVLITEGIGRHECPMQREWGGFVLIGGLIAAMSGKYIIPPEQGTVDWVAHMEFHTWEALWKTAEQHSLKLHPKFLGAMLRNFLPRRRDTQRMRPVYISNFSDRWWAFKYANDDLIGKFGSIRFDLLSQGREELAAFSPEEAESVKKVAAHIPAMLEIATYCIREQRFPV